MKKLCFFLSQLFTDLFKKKNKEIKESTEMIEFSTFNLEKHDNTYKKKSYVPPPIRLNELNDDSSSEDDNNEIFKSYSHSQNKFQIIKDN